MMLVREDLIRQAQIRSTMFFRPHTRSQETSNAPEWGMSLQSLQPDVAANTMSLLVDSLFAHNKDQVSA